MHIVVTRSGGFAGLTEQLASVDADTLPDSGRHVKELLQASGFFQMPAQVSEVLGADLFQYQITIKEGGREHRVAFVDDGSPAAASLLQVVQAVTPAA